jgi:hypothetical protein
MLVLFDHGVPRGIARALQLHTIKAARAQGWDTLNNGALLKAAEDAGFDVLLTTDTNLPLNRWSLVRPTMQKIVDSVNAAKPGTCTVVEIPESA